MSIFKNASYWDKRYRKGGKSGEGSTGNHRKWKWSVIDRFIDVRDSSIVDMGCGDLRFWDEKDCKSYIGIDLSKAIVDKNREKRCAWGFVVNNSAIRFPLKADVVFCMDVLFHIMNETDYQNIISNAISYSSRFVVIYTWDTNPIANGKERDDYQYFRKLDLSLFDGYRLIAHEINPHSPVGALYIFERL